MTYTSNNAEVHLSNSCEIKANQWGEDIIIDEKLVKKNLQDIQKKIAPCKSRIIAVTKYYGKNSIITGYNVGIRDFGESRALESVQKIESLPSEIKENSLFHFIGHLQTNKVDIVVKNFDYIHSIDSVKVAKAVDNVACKLNKREKVLLQVNNAGEIQKYGFYKDELFKSYESISQLENIEIVGLMNMTPVDSTEDEQHKLFQELRLFKDELNKKFGCNLTELSMGMSNDYKIAVQEGATMIRVGRKLFK